MNYFIKLLISAALVVILASLLPGIAVSNYFSAIIVAFVMALLNTFIKPLLIFFTLPATIFTLGLFLFVINAVIVLMASGLVGGFYVSGFWSALLFSLLFSLFQSALSQKTKQEY
jgi:putative membrane protein